MIHTGLTSSNVLMALPTHRSHISQRKIKTSWALPGFVNVEELGRHKQKAEHIRTSCKRAIIMRDRIDNIIVGLGM